jgi:prepilin-type N-terminal cleavage/methylation domain-containing protein
MMNLLTITTKNNDQSGFTLIEVLTGMVISAMTISMSANLVVTANIYKVVAKKNAQMQSLVQTDLEKVKTTAKSLAYDATKCTAYASALQTALLANAATSNSTIDSYSSAVATSASNDPANKIGNDGDRYRVTRTIGTIGTSTPNILPIEYTVKRLVNGVATNKIEYSIYTEVIPDAVFQCQ